VQPTDTQCSQTLWAEDKWVCLIKLTVGYNRTKTLRRAHHVTIVSCHQCRIVSSLKLLLQALNPIHLYFIYVYVYMCYRAQCTCADDWHPTSLQHLQCLSQNLCNVTRNISWNTYNTTLQQCNVCMKHNQSLCSNKIYHCRSINMCDTKTVWLLTLHCL